MPVQQCSNLSLDLDLQADLQQQLAEYTAADWEGFRVMQLKVQALVSTCIASLPSVLYCTALYCTVLYRIVPYCTVLYRTVLYCIALYRTVLYYTVLYCTVTSMSSQHFQILLQFGFIP